MANGDVVLHATGRRRYCRIEGDKGLLAVRHERTVNMFGLDRFRFDKNAATAANKDPDNGSKSPESEKENKPGD